MTTPILTVAPAGTWNLDPVHSRVDFEVGYLAGTFKGEFHEIAAELAVEAQRASLEGTAKVASVDVKDESLSAHLQSPDFFDAERHPELRFAAQHIRLDGDGKLAADGELTIKGITKPVAVSGAVTAPIADPYGNDRIGLNLWPRRSTAPTSESTGTIRFPAVTRRSRTTSRSSPSCSS
jgi:polyisoprenoid-binding protein YceI